MRGRMLAAAAATVAAMAGVTGAADAAGPTWGQIGSGAGTKVTTTDPPAGQFRFAAGLAADPATQDVYLLDFACASACTGGGAGYSYRLTRFKLDTDGNLVFDDRSDLIGLPDTSLVASAAPGRALVFDAATGRLYAYFANSAGTKDGAGIVVPGKLLAFDAATLQLVQDPDHGIVDGVVPIDLDPGTADDLRKTGSIALSPDGASLYVSGTVVGDDGTARGAVYRFSTATWQRVNQVGTSRGDNEVETPTGITTNAALAGTLPDGDVLVRTGKSGDTGGGFVIKRFTPDGALVENGTMVAGAPSHLDDPKVEMVSNQADLLPAGFLTPGPALIGQAERNLAGGTNDNRAAVISSVEPLRPRDFAHDGGAGSVLRAFGATGSGRCQFSGPPLLFASAGDGTVYVLTNSGTEAIRRFGFGGSDCVGAGLSNRPPQGSFGVSNPTPLTGEEVTFDATPVKDPDGTVQSYEWDLDGDPSTGTDGFETTGPNPTKTYDVPGDVTVRMRATDDQGDSTTVPMTLTVIKAEDPPPPPDDSSPQGDSSPPPTETAPTATPTPAPTVTPPAPLADRTAPKVVASTRSLKASRKGTIKLALRCPTGETRCQGTLKLQLKQGKGKHAKMLTVGSGHFHAAGGKRATVTVKLSSKARSLLRHGRIKPTLTIAASDAAGNKRTTKATLTIRR